jgi:hypothetical protein
MQRNGMVCDAGLGAGVGEEDSGVKNPSTECEKCRTWGQEIP